MRDRLLRTLAGLLTAASCLSVGGSAMAAVSFSRDLAAVLQDKCVTCHGPEKQKGGYRIDSFEWLRKPGDSGDSPLTPGEPASSLLWKLVTAEDEEDRMPQKDSPLDPAFVEKLRLWIGEGAIFDGANPKQALIDLVPTVYPTPPKSYPHALPVLSLTVLPGAEPRIALGGYHEILIRKVDGELVQRIGNLPERIHALVPLAESDQLLYAGGNPGRLGEMGVIDLKTYRPRVLARSADSFLSIAVSPDGKTVAVGGADKLIRLLETETGNELRQFSQHADWVMGLAFSHNGSRLVSASRDGTARVFDPGNGGMIATFREHEGPVFDATFVGDSSVVASCGRDGHVRFWKADKANQTGDIGGLGGEVFKLIVSEERLMCAVSNGHVVEVRTKERKRGREWSQRKQQERGVISIGGWISDGAFVAGDNAGHVTIWKVDADQADQGFFAWPE